MEEVSGIFPSHREGSNDLGPLLLRPSRNDGGGLTGTQKPDPGEPGALRQSQRDKAVLEQPRLQTV